jgi:hypothetical protein
MLITVSSSPLLPLRQGANAQRTSEKLFCYNLIPACAPKEKLDKIGQPSLVLGLELLIFRSWQAKRATY